MAEKKAKKLIIDSNAFIKGVKLETIGSEFWTIPQVISEVRDVKAREFLAAFPFEIHTREPSPAAMNAVIAFARKTGDYAFLSSVDLRVLALTYTFESELKGTSHLRTQPLQPGSLQGLQPQNNENSNESTEGGEEGEEEIAENEGEKEEKGETPSSSEAQGQEKENETNGHSADASTPEDADKDSSEAGNATKDDDDGWITPNNIGIVRARRGKEDDTSSEEVEVGCLTTDYAMQSVLLQMGLKLLSVDGMVIKKIRQYVLKCYSCFTICKNMEKKFCPKCGNSTLLRFSVSTDDNGNLTYTQAQKYTKRGSVFPIPLPRGGRNSKDLILTEDHYLNKTQYMKDPKTADVFSGDYSFAQGKSGPTQRVVVGFGNKNPNVAKRRVGKKNKPFVSS